MLENYFFFYKCTPTIVFKLYNYNEQNVTEDNSDIFLLRRKAKKLKAKVLRDRENLDPAPEAGHYAFKLDYLVFPNMSGTSRPAPSTVGDTQDLITRIMKRGREGNTRGQGKQNKLNNK